MERCISGTMLAKVKSSLSTIMAIPFATRVCHLVEIILRMHLETIGILDKKEPNGDPESPYMRSSRHKLRLSSEKNIECDGW